MFMASGCLKFMTTQFLINVQSRLAFKVALGLGLLI